MLFSTNTALSLVLYTPPWHTPCYSINFLKLLERFSMSASFQSLIRLSTSHFQVEAAWEPIPYLNVCAQFLRIDGYNVCCMWRMDGNIVLNHRIRKWQFLPCSLFLYLHICRSRSLDFLRLTEQIHKFSIYFIWCSFCRPLFLLEISITFGSLM